MQYSGASKRERDRRQIGRDIYVDKRTGPRGCRARNVPQMLLLREEEEEDEGRGKNCAPSSKETERERDVHFLVFRRAHHARNDMSFVN